MSRSGYTDYDDDDNAQWNLIKWRGQVASSIRGKRGQAFLRDLAAALDAMPEKRLIRHELRTRPPAFVPPEFVGAVTPSVCAIGSLGAAREIDLEALDPEDYDSIADAFDIAHQLVQEIEFQNDEAYFGIGRETSEHRWERMRTWVSRQITPEPTP